MIIIVTSILSFKNRVNVILRIKLMLTM